MVTDTVKLSVEMGRSAVKDQAEQLTDLRSRAGTLLAAASIAGTFAGATHGSIDTLAALALIAYLCNLGACIYVLLPHELAIEFRGTVLLAARAETGAATRRLSRRSCGGWNRCAPATTAACGS